jgi:predicted CXXCH cytochrome family protein
VELEIDEPAEIVETDPGARHALSLRDTTLKAATWSWALVLTIAAFFLVPPLSASMYPPTRDALRASSLAPSDKLWQAGPLHPSHQFIGGNCNACHGVPFRHVANAECTACHKSVQHHVKAADRAIFQEHRCGDCHTEHEEPSMLVQRDSRQCTRCHARLDTMKKDTQLANVTDFGTDHPSFRVTNLERSGLTFSHAEHMDPKGIKSPRGYEKLTCASCHQPESSGQHMLPIRMQTHCARCHSLQFDEHDPSTTVPHGDLAAAFETLQAHFIRRYMDTTQPRDSKESQAMRRPGGETEIMARDEQRRARDWADKQSLLAAGELLEKRVCNQCHRITRVSGATGFAQWRVQPVRITRSWLPFARFNHAIHGTTPCDKCHADAAASKASSDVLMPKIGVCRECHGGGSDSTRLPSDCGMCHAFHLPGRGLFDPQSRSINHVTQK